METGANEPFLVTGVDSSWLIRSGIVDVFSVDVADGEPIGPRSHLFRLVEGEMLLGMAHAHDDVGLLAVPGMGTSLVRIPQSRLQELGRDPDHRDAVAAWTEAWAAGFLSAFGRGKLPPRDCRELVFGRDLEVDEGQSVSVHSGFAWLSHGEGGLRLCGGEGAPIPQAEFFPLCAAVWLTAAGKTAVRVVDTQTVLSEDPNWAGLDAFHRLMLDLVAAERRRSEERDRQRVEATAQVDQSALENAYTHLASVFVPEVERYVDMPEDQLLAACRMVGQALGLDIRPHPDSERRVKQADPLAGIAKASRIRTRKILLEDRWWRRDAGPLLGYIEEGNRPVALLPSGPGRYVLWNPAEKTRTRVDADVAASLAPFGHVFYRTFPDRAISAKEVILFGLFGCGRDIRRILLTGVAIGLLGLVTPVVTSVLFDAVIPGGQLDQLLTVVVAMSVSALAVAVFDAVRGFALLRIEGRADGQIEAAVWDRLLNLPLRFFRRFTAGDLALRAIGASRIRQMLSGAVVSTVLGSMFSLFSAVLLFYYSWQLALVALAILGLGVLVSAACICTEFRYLRPLFDLQGRIQGLVFQFIGGIGKLRVSGAENRALSSWARMFAEQKRHAYKARRITAGFSVFAAALPVLSTMAIYACFVFVDSPALQRITAGSFLAFTSAFSNILTGGIAVVTALMPVLMAIPLAERIGPIVAASPEVDVDKPLPGELAGRIEVSHVDFRYSAEAPIVLKDVSFAVEPGEFVAVVGPSGSGKSTLFRLLLGFESPDAGSIYYDEQDMAGLDIQALRGQLGVVLQTSEATPGTIFDNIIGASLLSLDDAWQAARMCGLAEDIEEMPMGMQTVVAEGGAGLSGGQRQRILIARAIVRRPRILFFDEATSALDNKTQAIVSKSLGELKATRIVIAHRLSTIINADRILVLSNGHLVQSGTYEELMEQEGVFADLARRQIVQ